MAAFDPSVIATIPDSMPNPAMAKQQAYTLASEMDQQTLHRMQLKEAQQTQVDEAKAKQIVKSAKNDTAQDRALTAERLRKEVGPEYSNRFIKEAQGVESGDYAVQLQKYDLLAKQQDAIVGAVDSVITQVESYKQNNPGATPAQIDAKTQEIGSATMAHLAQQRPDLRPAIARFGASPDARTFAGWQSAEASSKEGRDRMNIRLSEHKAFIAEKEQKDRDRLADDRDRLAKVAEDRVELARQKQASDEQAKKEGLIDQDLGKDMAQQYLAGDKSVLVGIFRGKYGPQNIVTMRKAIRAESERQGLSPVDRVARMAAFAGFVAEEQTAGRRQATIQLAGTEFKKIEPIVLKAGRAVGRGNWVPISAIVQKFETMKSDPKLGPFAQAIDSTVNIYARAIAPTGVPHEAARARALQILSTADSEEDFEAKLDIMDQEVQAAIEAPDEVREKILEAIRTANAPRPGSPAAKEAAEKAAKAAPAGAGPPAAGAGPPKFVPSKFWEHPAAPGANQ